MHSGAFLLSEDRLRHPCPNRSRIEGEEDFDVGGFSVFFFSHLFGYGFVVCVVVVVVVVDGG